MKSKTLATIWLATGIVNGVSALSTHTEAAKSQAVAEVWETQADYLPELPELVGKAVLSANDAEHSRSKRNIYLGLTVTNLGLAAMYGSLAATDKKSSSQTNPSRSS